MINLLPSIIPCIKGEESSFYENSTFKGKKMKLLLRIVIVIVLSFSTVSVTVDGAIELCLANGNFTANDSYQAKLDSLLDSVATTNSSTMTYGLFNASIGPGQGSDSVEVMGYCRGDQLSDACRTCLNDSAYQIRQLCPLYKQAVVFEDNCTIKYSNGSMHDMVSYERYWTWSSPNNASNWDVVVKEVKQLVVDLQSEAASGGPLRKYATGNCSAGLDTYYAAVQCSPDLTDQQCVDCLVDATKKLPHGKIGGEVWVPNCQLEFEDYRFFDNTVPLPSPPPPSPPPPPPPPSPPHPPPGKSKTWIVVVTSVVSTVLLIGLIAFLVKKIKKRHFTQRLPNADDVIMMESLQFNLDVIREATENFSNAKKLGQGGFGSVYLGKLPNGQEIAVKRLSGNSSQGQSEFKNEVVLLAKLQHRNLVRLLGFCLEGDESLLVYEFVPNSSLDRFIFDPLKRRSLDWDVRSKIITGIARGLVYLHEDSQIRIIHRDLKASNILLDADMNPKVSDFGMARLFEINQTQADTKRIVGTCGYMAPEYALHGLFSIKSDVFSFGVLVLEIVSGQRNLNTIAGEDPNILIRNIWRNWHEGKISNIIDPLVKTGNSKDIVKCIHIGLSCVQDNVASRPTMASVILMLNSHSAILPILTQLSLAGEVCHTIDSTISNTSQSDRAGNNTGSFSGNKASFTQPYPR